MTRRPSPVDEIAKSALSELKSLEGGNRSEALRRLIEARDSSKNVSEKIFILLATLLLPIILFLFLDMKKFDFLGIEFALNNQTVFFFFFIGNLFYVYKISHFAKVVAAEKVIYEMSKYERPNLDGLTNLLPYNLSILVSPNKALTFYLKYFSIAVYSLIYFVCLIAYVITVSSATSSADWILGIVLLILNIASMYVSLLVFPNTAVHLRATPKS